MFFASSSMMPRYGLSLLHDVRFETEVTANNRKFKFYGLVYEMKTEDHLGFPIIVFIVTSCHSVFIVNASDAILTAPFS
jgi:hypothetical protein